ncbi:hypothetical protein KM043_002820 [Ampulex compressa]|nr:hypothetical protein KM043_002820 [Ampulex compressa]
MHKSLDQTILRCDAENRANHGRIVRARREDRPTGISRLPSHLASMLRHCEEDNLILGGAKSGDVRRSAFLDSSRREVQPGTKTSLIHKTNRSLRGPFWPPFPADAEGGAEGSHTRPETRRFAEGTKPRRAARPRQLPQMTLFIPSALVRAAQSCLGERQFRPPFPRLSNRPEDGMTKV